MSLGKHRADQKELFRQLESIDEEINNRTLDGVPTNDLDEKKQALLDQFNQPSRFEMGGAEDVDRPDCQLAG